MERKRRDLSGICNFKAVSVKRASVWALLLITLTAAAFVGTPGLSAQQEATRKIKKEIQPQYPPVARRLGITGTVRVSVTVTPDGRVKSAHAIGGHPMFLAAAEEAARKCEYESSGKETSEVLEFHFEKDGS
jgi:TonB family protein